MAKELDVFVAGKRCRGRRKYYDTASFQMIRQLMTSQARKLISVDRQGLGLFDLHHWNVRFDKCMIDIPATLSCRAAMLYRYFPRTDIAVRSFRP